MKKKILYIATNEIKFLDIPLVLDELGYYTVYEEPDISVKAYSEQDVSVVDNVIQRNKPDYVFSCDFSRNISEACFKQRIPYISWVYDCPQEELYSIQARYPYNYIFVFDKKQSMRLRETGIDNVYHVPLAVYPDRIKLALKGIKDKQSYKHDITFVGGLYYMTANEQVISCLNDVGKQAWDGLIQRSFMRWDKSVKMHGILPDEFVGIFENIDKRSRVNAATEYPFITSQFRYETAILSRYLAYRERTNILNKLADKYHVAFYTTDKKLDDLNSRIEVLPGISYNDLDIFKIYNRSKININITLHCIETGVSQRVFDVMASGGFMISNYQEELEELFDIGHEIVIYHDEKELMELIEYYMIHDDEREAIARCGQDKVFSMHNYQKRFKMIMSIVDEREAKRNTEMIRSLNEIKNIGEVSAEEKNKCLQEIYNTKDALLIYKYGKIWNSDDDDISMYLASVFMDMSLWREALKTLEDIKNKSDDVQSLIKELEEALK